jgi:aconitate hydratase
MGAELGATTSVFPSDENTEAYLIAQGRADAFLPLAADEGAVYDDVLEVDLSTIEPLAAMPHSPDNVSSVLEIGPIRVNQVAIGSCTNSSYSDLMKVAAILKGRRVHPEVGLVISPGSARILSKLAKNGALSDLIDAGARIIENACGPCIGMGQSPASGAVSLRTFNRNFKGRSGTLDAEVYLVSPETAALSAITGVLSGGKKDGEALGIELTPIPPENFKANESFVIRPDMRGREGTAVVMGPNIKPFPRGKKLEGDLSAKVVLHIGDNVTTDDIMPSDSSLLPYRSNIPYLANFCFAKMDSGFAVRAKDAGSGAIIGGENYGQGSSREHAALAPLYLGIQFVVAKSFARIHRSNLINSGILPLVFTDPTDYEKIHMGTALVIADAAGQLCLDEITLRDPENNREYCLANDLTDMEKKLIRAGGKINYLREI